MPNAGNKFFLKDGAGSELVPPNKPGTVLLYKEQDMRDKRDIRKDYLQAHTDAINEIIRNVCKAENDVRDSESNRYWRACDTLYRLTLHIWDTKADLDRKLKTLNAEMKEVFDAEKKAAEAENTQKEETMDPKMGERFDKRDDMDSNDGLNCWCIKD